MHARCASTSTGANDRELPLILGLMPILPKHADRRGNVRGYLDDAARSAPAPIASARSGRAPASPSSAIRTTGAATCRSIAACGISTRSASTISASRTPRSRRSSAGFTISASRTSRCGGAPATISRRRKPGRWSRKWSPTARRSRRTFWCSTPAVRNSPTSACAKRCRCCSTSNGSTRTTSSISTSAPAATLQAPTFPPTAARRTIANATLLAAIRRRGSRRHHGRHVQACRQRHQRPRPRDAAPRARPARAGRLRGLERRLAPQGRPGSPSPSKSWPRPAIRNGSRLPMPAI